MKSILFVFLLTASLLKAGEFYGETRILWGIPVTVTFYIKRENSPEKIANLCFLKLKEIGYKLNYYDPNSEISAINKNSGKRAVKVSKETYELIKKALAVSKMTKGAFDITVRPLFNLWDFKKKKIPSTQELIKAKEKVSYRSIVLDQITKSVFLTKEGMEIDVGGIVKGFMADICVDILKNSGAYAGMVAVGGDIKVFGKKKGNRLWKIGIREPGGNGIVAFLEITDVAISTSGDYERFFVKEGKRYHHIIDPHTGFPAKGIRSVTVIAKEGALADALATALFVLGLKKAKSLPVEFVIVDSSGKVHISAGLRNKVFITAP